MRRGLVRAIAAAAVAMLALAPAGAAFAADGDDDPGGGLDVVVTVPPATADAGTPITNAQLRWGLNAEAGSGAFAGGCNFLSAGRAASTGSARVWTAADGLYRAVDGNVRIEKPNRAGEWAQASWDTRCLDAAGAPLSVASVTSNSQNQVVIGGGAGSRGSDGALRIQWSGSFTVVFYGGMTYWSATDPVLSLDSAGNGTLTATASGYGTSMDDMSKWEPIPGRTIVLADLRGAEVGRAGGFSIVPQYLGVAVGGAGQAARTSENASFWGSFPASFISFQQLTGQTGYWLTTGGQRDRAKPATTLWVDYDAASAAAPPVAEAGAGPVVQNPLRTRPAAAAVTSAQQLPAPPEATSVTRGGPALLASAASDALPAIVLPVGGAVLAALVSVLCVLQLAGVPLLPFRLGG